jgi:hypothetical protein
VISDTNHVFWLLSLLVLTTCALAFMLLRVYLLLAQGIGQAELAATVRK